MASGAEAARVKRDREDGVALGVNATPTFFIGRQVVSGAPDLDEFSRSIDQELAEQGVGLPSVPVPPAAPASTGASAPGPSKNLAKSPTASQKDVPAQGTNEPTPSFGLLGSASGGALSSFQTDAVTCSEAEAAKKQPTLINTSQLRVLLNGKTQPLFVDVRPAKEFAAGKIPGAINIPVDDMPQRWSTLPKDRVIVFYESGQSSGRYLRLRPRSRKNPAGAWLCVRSSQGVSGRPHGLGEIRIGSQQVNTQIMTSTSG